MKTPSNSDSDNGGPTQLYLVGLSNNGNGTFRVDTATLTDEVSTSQAAAFLNCSADVIIGLCEEGILDWRWVNREHGKRLVAVASLKHFKTHGRTWRALIARDPNQLALKVA